MENQRRLIGVLEEDLAEDVENDGQNNDADDDSANLRSKIHRLELLRERMARQLLKEAHDDFARREGRRCRRKRGG